MTKMKQQLERTKEQQDKCNRILAEVEKYGIKRKGKADYIRFLKGERLTLGETLMTKCYQCNGYGEQNSCASPDCPNFPYFMAAIAGKEIEDDVPLFKCRAVCVLPSQRFY